VRILLDDANTEGLDGTLATLDAHPNIEVRLYNPLLQRSARLLNFVTDFTRVNRRMHNKSFTADGTATIVGGRNVGNEYFGAGEGVEFTDLDVIAIGPAARDVSREFDLYWNSASAYPASRIIGNAPVDAAATLESKFAEIRADADSVAYARAVRETRLVQAWLGGELRFEWRVPSSCATTQAKRSTLRGEPMCCCSPRCYRRSGSRKHRSISFRRISCREKAAPKRSKISRVAV
jgi:putative cardiolipin synthase